VNNRECYQQLNELVTRGEQAATATVVQTKGATPREVGAKMLVRGDGTIEGTIGGGCGEAEVLETALKMLKTDEATPHRIVRVDLTEAIWEGADRICGGIMDVLVERWNSPSEELKALSSRQENDGCVRVIPLKESSSKKLDQPVYSKQTAAEFNESTRDECREVIRDQKSHTAKSSTGQLDLFYEYLSGEATVIIFGAGHIAQPLSRFSKMLEYRVVVVDDRPSFASSERFPDADHVIAEPFAVAFKQLNIDLNTTAILVTRGHRYDEFCLRKLLNTPAAYIGMLGSKRRVRAVFSSVLEDGFTIEQLKRVYAPIGIDLQANSPAEIAVSIMAELISIRRGGTAPHLRENVNLSTVRG
jgi:xanthine dehydrogenase accessory factor